MTGNDGFVSIKQPCDLVQGKPNRLAEKMYLHCGLSTFLLIEMNFSCIHDVLTGHPATSYIKSRSYSEHYAFPAYCFSQASAAINARSFVIPERVHRESSGFQHHWVPDRGTRGQRIYMVSSRTVSILATVAFFATTQIFIPPPRRAYQRSLFRQPSAPTRSLPADGVACTCRSSD